MVIKSIIGVVCSCLVVVSINVNAAYLNFDEPEFIGVFGEDYPVLNFTYDLDDGDPATADYFFEWVLLLFDSDGTVITSDINSTIESIDGVQASSWLFPEPGEYDLKLNFTTFHVVGGLPECGPHSLCYTGPENEIISSDIMHVTLLETNVLPVANAGVDQVVNESDAVNLNGNLSSDSDGNITSYSWTQTWGTAVVLNGVSTATPSFAAPVVTTDEILIFSLIVTDNGGGMSVADTIKITVNNDNGKPGANAGVDQIVNEGILVDLDGQASSDSDGEISDYHWIQTAGSNVTISDEDTATPSFTAPSVSSDTVLIFSLVVTDNNGGTDTASVTIKVNNVLVVDAGADQQMTEGDIVQLNGLNSLSVSGMIDSYQWTQTEGPTVDLDDSTSATPSFIAPAVDPTTLLVFELVVSDSNGSQDYDVTFVNVRDELLTDLMPQLEVQLINTVEPGDVLYQFETTSDPFTTSTNVQWEQIYGPAVILDDANTAIPSFTVPTVSADSVTTFEVRSEDVNGLIVRASVNVNILSTDSQNLAAPTANAGIDQVVTEGDTVDLDATASTDDGNIVSYYWQQTGGPIVMLSSIVQAQTSFVAPAIAAEDDGTELTFELVVTDDGGFMDRQSVTISISDNGIIAFADDVIAIFSSNDDGDPIGIQTINDASLVALEAVNPDSIFDDVNRPDALPYGLLDFSLRVEPGATVQVSIALPAPADANFTWWKYSSDSGWLDYSANTTFNAARDVMTITLTDNDAYDDDPTPGVIRDPGGLALASAPASGSSSSSGGGGSIGPLLLVFLLLGFFARTFAGLYSLNIQPSFYTRKSSQ